jgi:hypothetical protein
MMKLKYFIDIYTTSNMWRGVVYHISDLDGGEVKDFVTQLEGDYESAESKIKQWCDDNSIDVEMS